MKFFLNIRGIKIGLHRSPHKTMAQPEFINYLISTIQPSGASRRPIWMPVRVS